MKILIAGDSWGCGEWSTDGNVVHTGLQTFLEMKGYTVVNVSKGGVSNKYIIDKLKNKLSEKYDHIFFIQSDPLRDIEVSVYDTKWFKDYDDLISLTKKLLDDTYKSLNNIAVPIYCIGGCFKIDLNIIEKYENLNPVIPSMIELLGYESPNLWMSREWYKKLDDRWDIETLDKILDEFNKVEKFKNIPYFMAGSGHPDRHGLKKVFDFLSESVLK